MGLIVCPDCGKEFSDRIDACPVCACPTSEAIKEKQFEKEKEVLASNQIEVQDSLIENINAASDDNTEMLMSSSELKEFVISKVIPYIAEEMDVEYDSIFFSSEKESADIYVKNGDLVTGIVFRISVAPNRYFYVHYEKNKNFLQEMEEQGFKAAYANVSIGAQQEERFNRRVLLKDQPYFLDYKGLIYPVMPSDNVKYSLSSLPNEEERSKVIYCEKEKKSHLTVSVQAKYNKCTIDGLSDVLRKYNVKESLIQQLSMYLNTLMIAIGNQVSEERLILTFLNCVDFCNGHFLSDSVKIEKELIIPTCFELLDSDETINLSEHKMYTFAYFIFHYIETEGVLESISVNEMNAKKIDHFEENPKMFGFMHILNRAEKEEETLKNEKQKEYIKTELKEKLLEFVGIYENTSDEVQLRNILENLLPVAQEIRTFYFNHALSDKEIHKIFNLAYGMKGLLEIELIIREKNKNGSYGFFEKRKDQKEKTERLESYRGCLRNL